MNGGYIMVNCEGLDLTKGTTPQTITGLYAACQAAMKTGKPICAYNCTWGVIPVTPIPVFLVQINETQVIGTSSTLQIIVGNNDSVTINNMVA